MFEDRRVFIGFFLFYFIKDGCVVGNWRQSEMGFNNVFRTNQFYTFENCNIFIFQQNPISLDYFQFSDISILLYPPISSSNIIKIALKNPFMSSNSKQPRAERILITAIGYYSFYTCRFLYTW